MNKQKRTLFGFSPSTVFGFLFLLSLMGPLLLVAVIRDMFTPKDMLHPKNTSDPKYVEYWDKRRKSWVDRTFTAATDSFFKTLDWLFGIRR